VRDWDDVVQAAMALPGAELATHYGKPSIKVRGKTVAGTTAVDDDSFVLHVAQDEKAALIATDPDTFWQTPHYDGWPAVLVRYATPASDRIALLIERAWWDRASGAQRGDRPRP